MPPRKRSGTKGSKGKGPVPKKAKTAPETVDVVGNLIHENLITAWKIQKDGPKCLALDEVLPIRVYKEGEKYHPKTSFADPMPETALTPIDNPKAPLNPIKPGMYR
jgi:hypothetical protein